MKEQLVIDFSVGGLCYFVFGNEEQYFKVLIFLFFVNLILGLIKSYKKNNFDMCKLKDSLLQFIATVLLLISTSVILKLDGEIIEKLRDLNPYLMYFFLGYYFLSIIKNSKDLGVPFPKKIEVIIKDTMKRTEK